MAILAARALFRAEARRYSARRTSPASPVWATWASCAFCKASFDDATGTRKLQCAANAMPLNLGCVFRILPCKVCVGWGYNRCSSRCPASTEFCNVATEGTLLQMAYHMAAFIVFAVFTAPVFTVATANCFAACTNVLCVNSGSNAGVAPGQPQGWIAWT